MRKMFVIIFLLALSTALTAQQPALRADANPAAEAEIKALELKLADQIVHGGWDEYSNYLASDYLFTHENGHIETKDEALARLRDVKRQVIVMEMEPSDAVIRTYGDTAVSNASSQPKCGSPARSRAAAPA